MNLSLFREERTCSFLSAIRCDNFCRATVARLERNYCTAVVLQSGDEQIQRKTKEFYNVERRLYYSRATFALLSCNIITELLHDNCATVWQLVRDYVVWQPPDSRATGAELFRWHVARL